MGKTCLRTDFINAVERKDISLLRTYVANEIRSDPTFQHSICDECVEYAATHGVDITEPFHLNLSEEPTPTDTSKWDKLLFQDKVEYLRLNFAYYERIPELKEISRVAYAAERKTEPTADIEAASFKDAPPGRRSVRKKSSPTVLAGLIAAVVIIAAIIAFFLRK